MNAAPDPTYAAFAVLLEYPDDTLLDALDSIDAHVRDHLRVPMPARAGPSRCSTAGARRRCTCSSTCTANRAIAARRWSTCCRCTSGTALT